MPFFLIFTVGFVIFLNIALRSNKKSFNEILNEEISTPKEKNNNIPFPNELLLEKKLKDLSFLPADIKSVQLFKKQLEYSIDDKIICPIDKISNTEFKRKYGSCNLDSLSLYEENFREYIYSLNSIAKVLIEHNKLNEAKVIFDEIFHCKSNISNSYVLYYNYKKKLNDKYTLSDMLKEDDVKRSLCDDNSLIQNVSSKIKKSLEN